MNNNMIKVKLMICNFVPFWDRVFVYSLQLIQNIAVHYLLILLIMVNYLQILVKL